MDVSDHLRLPVRLGLRFTEFSAAVESSPPGSDNFKDQVDHMIHKANGDILTGLKQIAPQDTYLAAYIQGSFVQDRLRLAQRRWGRVVDLFDLNSVIASLKPSHDPKRVDAAVAAVQRAIVAALLGEGRRMGVSKLFLRLKKPDVAFFTQQQSASIAAFVASAADLSNDCDEIIQAVLRHTRLGKAERTIRKQFYFLCQQFEINVLLQNADQHFDTLVRLLGEGQCLNPLLPISPSACQRIAGEFGVSVVEANCWVTLFRFAWLSRFTKPKDFSDIDFVNLIVVPQEARSSDHLHHIEQLQIRAVDQLARSIEQQPDLARFRQKYPDVSLTARVGVVSLPRPLYEMFLAIDGQQGGERLGLITRYRMGVFYLRRYVASLMCGDRYGAVIREIDQRHHHALSRDVETLFQDIVYLRIGKEHGEYLKHVCLRSLDLTPEKLTRLFQNVIEYPTPGHIEACRWVLDDVAQKNLPKLIRGVWTVNTAQP